MSDPTAEASRTLAAVRESVATVVRGKDEVIELALVSLVAGGHVLLEDVPGVGKTTLAQALASAMGGVFQRIQFTADLLPGDITGVTVLSDGEFAFRRGPLFANVVLADEINRATPKTQSALLEAMSERGVTVDGTRHALPPFFVVIATQNPHDFHGTFPLPDSQLDRFLMRLSVGYPDRDSEREILRRGPNPQAAPAVLTAEAVRTLRAAVSKVAVHEEVEEYLLDLVARTRTDARLVRGVSTRGASALYTAAKALALFRQRAYVTPEDIRELAIPVLAHRVQARSVGALPGAGARRAVEELLWELTPPV